MTWRWKPTSACDLDELIDDINPQMKSLEGSVTGISRPSIMSGYPDAVGAIVDTAIVTVGATTAETSLKSVNFKRGAFGTNGGFRFRCGGRVDGSGGTKTITVKFGGITIISMTVSSGTRSWLVEGEFWNTGVTNEQRVRLMGWNGVTISYMLVSDETNYTSSVETN